MKKRNLIILGLVAIAVLALMCIIVKPANAEGPWILLEDNFTGNTGDLIAGRHPDTTGWSTYQDPKDGQWALWENGLIGHSGFARTFCPFLYKVGANIVVEATILPERSNFSPGLVFRSNPEGTDLYYVSLHFDWSELRTELRHLNELGTLVVVEKYYNPEGDPTKFHQIRVEAFGKKVTVFVDGVKRMSTIDNTNTPSEYVGGTSGDYWDTLRMSHLKVTTNKAFLPMIY